MRSDFAAGPDETGWRNQMPISRLVKYGLLSTTIYMGSTVAVQAQSDLPGCADQQVKGIVTSIIAENMQEHLQQLSLSELGLVEYRWDWVLESFYITHIVLADYNEHTGALDCNASLRGKRDRQMWERAMSTQLGMDVDGIRERHIQSGYWKDQDILPVQYTVSQSAEDPEYFIVNVIY